MKCQICYKRKATTTAFDKAAGQRVYACSMCKELLENRKETEAEGRESEQAAEFNAELGAGVYDLP